ncbi:RNA polymerase II transcription factor B subunit 1 [Coniosporium tulheliwenetii]|uniref:RNA polymerase II transcription factor B subunit 1 n=1 Tax=Coniosporium tulheliwenetii TaxID=3383036 RepID=A0ACC2YIG8_9PEZI|nr:RNA polymerase II transcription factor B subunit 1 [Cladosporium sp. JES 115]
MSIKVFVQRPAASEPEIFIFKFTSPTAAREEFNAIKDKLTDALAKLKAASAPVAKPKDAPAPVATASPATPVAPVAVDEPVYQDTRLLSDHVLQESLLKSDPSLNQRFQQALKDKPETISLTQFTRVFWASRLHLLRAHAVERSQSQGDVNVISSIKPHYDENGEAKLNVSKEQIQLLFKQHPIVKRLYDESVPELSERDFWKKFFQSRLFRHLRGEKTDQVSIEYDHDFDKYIDIDEEAERVRQTVQAHVPLFIDLEGNEQNHSQRKGNGPDREMRQRLNVTMKVCNAISEKMMEHITPADGDTHAPIGMDEETFNQLQLQDLQRNAEDNRILLKIRDQKDFFAREGGEKSAEAALYSRQSPRKVLAKLRRDVELQTSTDKDFDLQEAIGVHSDSDSDDEEGGSNKQPRIGSQTQSPSAAPSIPTKSPPSGTFATLQATSFGLSQDVADTLAATHNTTVEFLHYFWTVFLSGDPGQAADIQGLVESLNKSLDRIKAVAESAEAERRQLMEARRKQIEEYYNRTGKRQRFDPKTIGGGASVVDQMMAPTVRAIGEASRQYRKAFEEQMAQAQAQAQAQAAQG